LRRFGGNFTDLRIAIQPALAFLSPKRL
jgi:hypothetical protein